jgi:hypothetical protein
MNIDNLTLNKLAQELRLAAQKCPRCEGTRETIFTARGRDNVVNCLECEPIYKFLEPIEFALGVLKEAQE